MNLVATSDFRNQWLDKIQIDDAQHDLHVHKGARFSIGKPELPFDKLTQAEKQIVVALNNSGRILDADAQKDKVAIIDKEIAAAKAAEAKRKAASEVPAKK